MFNLGMCRQLSLLYYLAVQPIDDVAYKLSDLVKLIILYKSPALTFSEQHSKCNVPRTSHQTLIILTRS